MPHCPTTKKNRILQVDITSRCDLQCGNCTRALAQHKKPDMTPEQFQTVVDVCKDWVLREQAPGRRSVLSLWGGNPTCSVYFKEICEILSANLPEENRAIFTNNLNGRGDVVRDNFGPKSYVHVVLHGNKRAADEFRRELPWTTLHGEQAYSKHASIFVAARDFLSEDELWPAVEKCSYDINWSAAIMQEPPDWTKLGLYSCELAGSHARINGKALGVPLTLGCLDLQINAFRHQYDFACRRCGGCLNLQGVDDVEKRDQYSKTNEAIAAMTISKKRTLELIETMPERIESPVDYLRMRSAGTVTQAT